MARGAFHDWSTACPRSLQHPLLAAEVHCGRTALAHAHHQRACAFAVAAYEALVGCGRFADHEKWTTEECDADESDADGWVGATRMRTTKTKRQELITNVSVPTTMFAVNRSNSPTSPECTKTQTTQPDVLDAGLANATPFWHPREGHGEGATRVAALSQCLHLFSNRRRCPSHGPRWASLGRPAPPLASLAAPPSSHGSAACAGHPPRGGGPHTRPPRSC